MSNKKTKILQNQISVAENMQHEVLKINKFSNGLVYGLLAVVLLIYGFARVQLLEMPLERDEGSYAYIGQLLLDGKLPYKDFL